MKVHKIHDDSNQQIITLLEDAFSKIKEDHLVRNYHPDHKDNPGNFFYVLKNGRYNKGTYFVIEEDGKFLGSAGCNEYDSDTMLLLTRAYIAPESRAQYLMGNLLLPDMIKQAEPYKNVWITCNEYNKAIYNWFKRASEGKRPALFNDWPDIYRQFKPIGEKNIYYTKQFVLELQR